MSKTTSIDTSLYPYVLKSHPTKIIAISSSITGVGKSHTAASLAIVLAQKNKKVLLFDADLRMARITSLLGLKSKYNLSHLIQGKCQLNDAIVAVPNGINLIPGVAKYDAKRSLSSHEHAGIIDSFNDLSGNWDYLIIDTMAGRDDAVLNFTRSSEDIILIISEAAASLSETYLLIKKMNQDYQLRQFHILANGVRSPHHGLSLFNKLNQVTEYFLDISLDYLRAIPFDEQVRRSMKNNTSVVIDYPNSMASLALCQLAATIVEWPIKLNVSGQTNFFLERRASG